MKESYRLIPSKIFLKDLRKLPPDIKPKVEKALLSLKASPASKKNIKKLTNVDIGQYRMRIGDYRLRYDIEEQDIYLHIIRHRKDVYKK